MKTTSHFCRIVLAAPTAVRCMRPDCMLMLCLWMLCFGSDTASAQQPGALDTTFNPGSGASGTVRDIAVQADGRILIAGSFRDFNGEACNNIVRLSPDGSLDPSFAASPGPNDMVNCIAVQPDGRLVIGGLFTNVNGQSRNMVARLNANGSLDASFNPGTGLGGQYPAVRCVLLQQGGNILIGGDFRSVNGVGQTNLARLLPNGGLDATFVQGFGANGTVHAFGIQPDKTILIGGAFNRISNVPRRSIARLNPDGSLDTSLASYMPANCSIRSLALQPDGKIGIGGTFVSIGGTPRLYIARLLADGELDTEFDPGTGPSDWIETVALLSDGRLLIGGDFTNFNGVARNRLACLQADGSVDQDYGPGEGASGTVYRLLPLPDGRALVGGSFRTFDGRSHRGIVRLLGRQQPPAPFTLACGWSAGSLQLRLEGEANRAYAIQASQNLTSWQTWTNIAAEATNAWTFTLEPAPGTAVFFRGMTE